MIRNNALKSVVGSVATLRLARRATLRFVRGVEGVLRTRTRRCPTLAAIAHGAERVCDIGFMQTLVDGRDLSQLHDFGATIVEAIGLDQTRRCGRTGNTIEQWF